MFPDDGRRYNDFIHEEMDMIFTPESIRELFRTQPFRALRITANAGAHYDVRHPDLVWVGEREIHIGLPKVDDRPFFDRVVRIPLFHISGIEDLPVPASAESSAA